MLLIWEDFTWSLVTILLSILLLVVCLFCFVFFCFFLFFLRFTVFKDNIFVLKKEFYKNKLCKSQIAVDLLIDRVEIIFDRSSRSRVFFKTDYLKNPAISTRKHLCWSLFLTKLIKSSLLKRDFNTGIFLWILWIF